MLRRTTFGVAEYSEHIYGRAIDIYLPARLHDAMLAARAMQRGRRWMVSEFGFHPSRQRAGAQLDARR